MQHRIWRMLGIALVAAIVVPQARAHAQAGDPPNPYRTVENWAKLPDGRKWGQTISVDIDRDGKSIWVFERCGRTSCDGSEVAPILKIDPSGNVTKSFGAGMFVFPHGLHVDRDGNVWVTDGRGKGAKGHQVHKFSPDGKVLMAWARLGDDDLTPSIAFRVWSRLTATSSSPTGTAAPNARIVKFEGRHPHQGLGQKSRRAVQCLPAPWVRRPAVRRRPLNNRIQSSTRMLPREWKQFGRPSGVLSMRRTIYVAVDPTRRRIRRRR